MKMVPNAFELTNDLAVLTILHDYLIETNAKKDTIDAVCCQCKQIPKDGLKRCGKCYVTLYCSKECQRKHWLQKGHRNNCPGFVVARPFRMGEEVGECVQISFYKVLGSTKSQVKVYQRNALNSLTRSDFLRQRRFIVKVQLPIEKYFAGPSTGEIMVYNVDRSVEGFVYPHEPGYEKLSKKIEKDGFKQIKTFFWAELCESYDGTFKIFYGKCAPYQLW
ncbi:hypothetical protein FSP39_016598 [Pinctada imbricata]|uniref:MYND-type domain-containing protein n=1 Tax=Pinctada imbricata TaxID=66713 RepID=A0AA88YNH4_PINIB|nr:hypothetical protein FSP39_016598 [Pinctada imbricata]